jgi:hypothetical protein
MIQSLFYFFSLITPTQHAPIIRKIPASTNIFTSGGMLPLGYKSKLEDYALKRGAPNKMMTEQFGPVFDKFLTRKTTFKKTDDDW